MLFRDKPHSEQQFEMMTKTEFGIHKEKFIGTAHSFCVQLSLYFQRKNGKSVFGYTVIYNLSLITCISLHGERGMIIDLKSPYF